MFDPTDDQTVIAQCTPKGSGALALLRISGRNALSVTNKLSRLHGTKTIESVPTHTINHGWVIDENSTILDQVLFLVMHGPRSFTGENTVEITCHNNQFIIDNIVQRAVACGARLAQPGEFSKRAVLNNKIDLLQAEAINELIHANTQLSLQKSLEQLEGSLSSWICKLENHLLKALAFCQASFEFIDEEITFDDTIKKIIDDSLHTIATLKKSFNAQQQIRQGIRIAIIGSVNAGKSSLFNTLIGTNRAIVTSIAGTTRDVIETGLYKDGNYITMIDTAGLRQTDDVIEKEGIQRSFEQAEKADIVLLTFDGSRVLTDEEKIVYAQLAKEYENKIIRIINKADAIATDNAPALDGIHVSAHNKKNITALENEIRKKIADLFAKAESPFLLNQRQYTRIQTFEKKLHEIQSMLNQTIEYELLAIHLTDALEDLCQLTGKQVSESGMDMVFKEFCVGK